MTKGFLIGIVLLCFLAIGGMLAAAFGILPQPVYTFFFALERNLPFTAPSELPYLEKFEGFWTVSLNPAIAASDLADCKTVSGNIPVHNGAFVGAIGPFGSSMTIKGSATIDGVFSGTFSSAGDIHAGTFTGNLSNGRGSGTWSDNFECNGTITFTKVDAVIDPAQGRIVSLSGNVTFIRGGKVGEAFPGELLYEGDEIDTGTDGTILLDLGLASEPLTLTGNMHYVVSGTN